ncbi:MAG: PDZ domain-containing protein, partial [Blastocatellia bacterium]
VMTHPIASFSEDAEGEGATTGYAGVIGGEFLRRLKVIFDYSHRRLIVEPNSHIDEPDEDDMSGMDLTAQGADFKTFTVRAVSEGSPAADVGVQPGDVILAIDHKPASEFDLDQIDRMFKRIGDHLLQLRRGASLLQARIKLRRLI